MGVETYLLKRIVFAIFFTLFFYFYYGKTYALFGLVSALAYFAHFIHTWGYKLLGLGSQPDFNLTLELPSHKKLRCVCISDTHNKHASLDIPPGDVLIHAGDFTWSGTEKEIDTFLDWLSKQPHQHKIVIAGNHDVGLDPEKNSDYTLLEKKIKQHATYLNNELVDISGVSFYGSPISPLREHKLDPKDPHYFDASAFQIASTETGEQFPATLGVVGVDVLITHGPGKYLSEVAKLDFEAKGNLILGEIVSMMKPQYHIFGHIHEGYGVVKDKDTTHINASSLTLTMKPLHAPIVFDIELPGYAGSDRDSG